MADLDGGHGRDHHGTFQASFATFAEACEAMCVLSQIQKDLFYAVGWDSWADRGRSDADGPRRPRREDDKRLEYLYRLSREARAESTPEFWILPPVALKKIRPFSWTSPLARTTPSLFTASA